jgi:hypothetical protein
VVHRGDEAKPVRHPENLLPCVHQDTKANLILKEERKRV